MACLVIQIFHSELITFSSVDLLLDSEKTFTAPPMGNMAFQQTKDKIQLRLYPEPPLDKFFNVVVVTAPNPSNFFVSF